jgi:hypothetical protein
MWCFFSALTIEQVVQFKLTLALCDKTICYVHLIRPKGLNSFIFQKLFHHDMPFITSAARVSPL